jgi:hypothetical protein
MNITFANFLSEYNMIKVTIEDGLGIKSLTIGLSKAGQALIADLSQGDLIDPEANKALYDYLEPKVKKHASDEIWN